LYFFGVRPRRLGFTRIIFFFRSQAVPVKGKVGCKLPDYQFPLNPVGTFLEEPVINGKKGSVMLAVRPCEWRKKGLRKQGKNTTGNFSLQRTPSYFKKLSIKGRK
jgi:hypothetical protein